MEPNFPTKINYLSHITMRESNLFMCLLAEMMFLSSLSMPWNTVAASIDV